MQNEDREIASEAVETPSEDVQAEALEADEASPDDAEALESDETEADDADDGNQSEEDEGETDDADDAKDGQEQAQAETVEIEDKDGKKHRIPKELQGFFMMQKDYTQKTQALAETRKASDELRAVTERVGSMTFEEQKVFHDFKRTEAQIEQVNKELQGYANFNWQAAEAQDYDLYRQHESYFRQLTAQQQALAAEARGYQGEMQKLGHAKQEAQREEQTKRIAAVEAFAKVNIPGWDKEMDAKIGQNAKEVAGVTDAWMAQNLTPEMYLLAADALLGRQVREQAKKAKPKGPPKAIKPTSKVKSRAGRGGQKSIEKMSQAEYEAARKSGALR